MAFGYQPRKMPRILGPRVVIYLIILLAFAWVMSRYDKNIHAQKTPTPMPATPTITTEAQTRLPMIVLVASVDDDLDDLYQQVAKKLDGRYSVTITSAKDETSEKTLKEAFQTEALPVAILYDAENQELSRVGSITVENILGMVGEAL